jgi:hypothetical protein
MIARIDVRCEMSRCDFTMREDWTLVLGMYASTREYRDDRANRPGTLVGPTGDSDICAEYFL